MLLEFHSWAPGDLIGDLNGDVPGDVPGVVPGDVPGDAPGDSIESFLPGGMVVGVGLHHCWLVLEVASTQFHNPLSCSTSLTLQDFR